MLHGARGKRYIEEAENAKSLRRYNISYLILATARALDAKLVTGDEHFKGMDEIIWIGQ
ncbi:MAG: hypothetical protein QXK30_02110 [Candidatus Bathyarchaeia archaeon]